MRDAAKHSSVPKQTLLIVDDEAVIRDLCARALVQYRVLQAEDGSRALEILRRETVDVVLSDIMMPVMNGLDLLDRIKEQSPGQVVVMMTGFSDKDVILRALKSGADDFIHKPINLLQLKSSVARALDKKSLREELIELKQMDRLKSEFLGLISHKLRTPITVISLFIQNLVRDLGPSVTAAYRDNLTLILEETEHLNRLIQDLLSFSSVILDNRHPELRAVDPAELLAACLLDFREIAEHRHITFLFEPPETALPTLLADREHLLFSLRAVIDNALKFTPPGGTVRLACEHDDNTLRVVVQDDGPGIPPEEQGKVFERFYQVDPEHTGQVRGFGLGLYYARQFVQDHGGSLILASVPGQGTTVTLRLPC